MGVVFDNLGFLRKLQGDGGFSRPQADRLAGAFYDAIVESVATKQDLGDVRVALRDDIVALRTEMTAEISGIRTEIGSVRSELKGEINSLRTELNMEIAELRTEVRTTKSELRTEIAQLKVWIVGSIAAAVSIMVSLKVFT